MHQNFLHKLPAIPRIQPSLSPMDNKNLGLSGKNIKAITLTPLNKLIAFK